MLENNIKVDHVRDVFKVRVLQGSVLGLLGD